jgi:PelA/Pel-15E family pectate lyase
MIAALVAALLTVPQTDGATVKATPLPITTPRLHTYRGELLAQSKQRLRNNDSALTPALAKLMADADSVFRTGPYTVTAKQRMPPSGDKRDYQSFAPYWWPDPTKPDGLPYIQRDGQFNMELRRDSDVLRWYAMTDAVETLAQAWYFSERPEYAHRAGHLLRVWFLNDSTRMNPHLKYAQAILGRTEGRGIGIIDTRDLGRLFDAIALLEGSSAWSDADARGLHDWAARYLDWLLTSQHGQEEAATRNNHSTWYDVQIAALALFVGDTARVRATFEKARVLRIATQIDAEGKQPLELARTRSLHYSVENLDGFTRLAEMARTMGVDLWNWSAATSGGIRKAIAFVRPYADPTVKWPYPQITEEPADMFVQLLRRADAAYGEKVPNGIPAEILRTHRAQLLYPEPQAQSDDNLLAPARIAALPTAAGESWRDYIARSQANRKRDLDSINAELRAAGRTRWTPAPVGSGFAVTDAMNADWFKTKDALALGDAIVSYQTPSGGWSKRVDYQRPRARGQSFASEDGWDWIGTLDNGATTEQLHFLAGVVRAQGRPQHRAALERGLEYLLMSQYPTGCWPQIYPLAGGYHDAATFNDDATVHALQVLRSLARGEYNVGMALRERAASAVERGVSCIIATQVEVAGTKTVWGAQHDPITFQPVKARSYEHASLSGRESAGILDFLMQVPAPSAQVVRAVHAGAAWFRASAIRGYSYVPRGVLTEKANGGPLWARFYELQTNRPIFSDRDGVVKYSLSEIGEERRRGYLWYTDEPAATLRRYDAWAQRHPLTGR